MHVIEWVAKTVNRDGKNLRHLKRQKIKLFQSFLYLWAFNLVFICPTLCQMKITCLLLMKQKLHALDAFFIEKLKLSENDPDTPWKTWNRPLGSGTVGTRMILNNMKNHSREYYMTFWSSTNYSDFRTDQTHQFTTLIPTFTFTNLRPWCRPLPLPIYERFPLSISMGVACQQGTFTLLSTWFRPFLGLVLVYCGDQCPQKLPWISPLFHFEYP